MNAPKRSTITVTYCRGVPEVPMHKLGNYVELTPDSHPEH